MLVSKNAKIIELGKFRTLKKYTIHVLLTIETEISPWEVYCGSAETYLAMKKKDFFKFFPSLGTWIQMLKLKGRKYIYDEEIVRMAGRGLGDAIAYIPARTLAPYRKWVLLAPIAYSESRSWIAKMMQSFELIESKLKGKVLG